jgi:hypothetical protein
MDMNSNAANDEGRTPSRRIFLRRGMMGAWVLGLGSLAGWFSPRGGVAPARAATRSLGKEYTYDVSRFQKTDPSLITHGAAGSIATGLKEPRRLVVGSNDQILVAGDRSICVFDKTGQRLQAFATGDSPRCLAVDTDGKIYVGLKDHVEVYQKSGERMAVWPAPAERSILTAIAVGENDAFVADAGSRLVWHYNLAGRLIKSIGKKNEEKNIPGFIVPSPYFDLALGSDGLLWVANPGRHRLEAYTFGGDFEIGWGEVALGIEGFCGCCNPVNFALMEDVRFVTCEKGLTRVKVYSPKGKFEGVVAGPEQFPKHLNNANANPVGLDVAVDTAGRVLVADPLNSEIRIFTPLKKSSLS